MLDLFEKLMGGALPEALADLKTLYDAGADPLAVMQDLLETTHFLTRIKVAPAAQGFFNGGSSEAKRAGELAAKLSVPVLTRAWQMLLKGLMEVRDATRPISALEMALIRVSYAADLPPTDKLVRDLLDNKSNPPLEGGSKLPPRGGGNFGEGSARSAATAPRLSPQAAPQTAPTLSRLEDIVALAIANNAPFLKAQIETCIHLVRLEPGLLEFRPTPAAPRTLAGDLQQKLNVWTGLRWSVSIAREGGAPTLGEQRKAAKAARMESVAQEPMVRAVLDRFPGAEIVAVRDVAPEDVAAPMPDESDA